jgi:hypothetical protein
MTSRHRGADVKGDALTAGRTGNLRDKSHRIRQAHHYTSSAILATLLSDLSGLLKKPPWPYRALPGFPTDIANRAGDTRAGRQVGR